MESGIKYTSPLKLYYLLYELSLCNKNNNTNTSDSFDIYITPLLFNQEGKVAPANYINVDLCQNKFKRGDEI